MTTSSSTPATPPDPPGFTPAQQRTLRRWAASTWTSLEAMTFTGTGLPADGIGADLSEASRSRHTSPTNIGALLWCTIAARELGIIDARVCRDRLRSTLTTLSGMRRHEPSGLAYNWYDPATGLRREVFPGDDRPIHQFMSSVDNGWLACGLQVVRNAAPELADLAETELTRLRLDWFLDLSASEANPRLPDADPGGLLRGGFFDQWRAPHLVEHHHPGATDPVFWSDNHYGQLNSEPRITSYLGIARGLLPASHYWALPRAQVDPGHLGRRLAWAGHEELHEGHRVWQAVAEWRGHRVVPTWGGSAFEAFMPELFVHETRWGARSWAPSHRSTALAQRDFGLEELDCGYFGFSPASTPDGGYGEWGVEPIGTTPWPYPADVERTGFAHGHQDGWGDVVVTPHATSLMLPFVPDDAFDCLQRMESRLGCCGPGGFLDAVGVRSGRVAARHLCLDQGMLLAALANVLCDGVLRDLFCSDEVEAALRPMLEAEQWDAGEA